MNEERREIIAYLRWRDTLPDLSDMDPDEAWATFQALHEGKCAMCRQPPKVKLLEDHDHETGRTRGLLCPSCNGRRWWRIVELYAEYPPSVAAGLYRRYPSYFWKDPADRVERILWHVDSNGQIEAEEERQVRALVAIMRNRDWGGALDQPPRAVIDGDGKRRRPQCGSYIDPLDFCQQCAAGAACPHHKQLRRALRAVFCPGYTCSNDYRSCNAEKIRTRYDWPL